jgi:integrase
VSVETRLRPSTLRDYRMSLGHVNSRLGAVRLQDLTPLQCEEAYQALLVSGRHGRPLSAKTVGNVHTALRRCLGDAERLGLVMRNAAAAAHPPRAVNKEMATSSADELRRFLEYVADDRLVAAYRLIASTGMRRGEALGLQWSDVDLQRSAVSINRSLTAVDGVPTWSAPKTARSRRRISLDPATVEVLRQHRTRQLQERLVAGDVWEDADLVFCREDGTLIHPDRFTKAFERARNSAGLPPIRLHDLRHTYATLALQAGVHPKIVSDRLGHAGIAITLDLYSHVLPSLDAEAASTVANLFAPVTDRQGPPRASGS